jgi:hypothetical protein
MSPKILAVFALVVVVASTSGCSGGPSAGRTVSGWFGGSETPAATGRTVYAGKAGAEVRSKPIVTGKSIGRLSPYEKVVQTDEKNGFAKIRARRGKLEGWVPAAGLVRRPPSSSPAEKGPGPNASAPQPGSVAPAATNQAESIANDDAAPVGDSFMPAAEPGGDAAVVAAPAPPAAKPATAAPEPVGPEKPRGVGASVFDPY